MNLHKFFESIGMMTTMFIWGFLILGIAAVVREKILSPKTASLEDEDSEKTSSSKAISRKTEDEILDQTTEFDDEDHTFDPNWSKRNCTDEQRAVIIFEREKARQVSVKSKLLTMYVQKIIAIEEELAELFPLFSIKQDIENQFLSTNVSLKNCEYWKDEIRYQNYSNHIMLRRDIEIMRAFYLRDLKTKVNLGCECLQVSPSDLSDAIYLTSRHFIGFNNLRKRLIKDYSLLQYHCWQKRNKKENLTDGENYFAKMYGAKLLARKLELELPKHFEDKHEEQILKI